MMIRNGDLIGIIYGYGSKFFSRRFQEPKLDVPSCIYVRLAKLLVHEKDINIIWKCPIANHSFVAILPSLRNIDLQGVSLRLNAAEVDMILYS